MNPSQNVFTENQGATVLAALRLEASTRHAEHQPPLDLNAWNDQSEQLLQRIREAAGALPARCPLDVTEHGRRVQRAGYHIRKITYQSRPGFRVTANLYIPEGPGPFPAVVNVHGHDARGKMGDSITRCCDILTSDGFICLAIDAFGSGERGTTHGEFEYHGAGLGSMLFNLGESLLGMQVCDNMRGVDLLQSLDFVDSDRIGVTGSSGGGNQTMWLAALDDRIKAAVPVVSVGTFEAYVGERNCVCEVLPGGLRFMEEWAALGLVAPNALLILNALRDCRAFSVQQMLRSFQAAREVYDLYDARDRLAYQAFDVPHSYGPDMLGAMLGWMRRWLKHEGEGRPCAVEAREIEDRSELACFADGERPDEVLSIASYVAHGSRRAAEAHAGDEELAPHEMAESLRRLIALPPEAEYAAVSEIRRLNGHAHETWKFTVEPEHGIPLPLTVLTRSRRLPERLNMVLHPGGKQTAAELPTPERRLSRHAAVAFADLRGTGETAWDTEPLRGKRFHDASRAALWLGRTMVGDWARDIQALTEYFHTEHDVQDMSLVAYEEAAMAALCAAAVSGDFKALTLHRLQGSYVVDEQGKGQPMALAIPGILGWGDVATLVALAGEAEIQVIDPVHADGTPYTHEECSSLQAAIDRQTERLGLPPHATVESSS